MRGRALAKLASLAMSSRILFVDQNGVAVATMDDVDKAIIDHFRQAGPSLIKLERKSANRAVHGMFTGTRLFYHCSHQVWKSAIFSTLPLRISTILELFSVASASRLSCFMPSSCSPFHVLINCIPNVTFARPFFLCVV